MRANRHDGTVKLQRVVNRVRGENTYYKWQVTLPPDAVETLGWKEGDELEAETKGNRLVMSRKRA